MTGAPENRDRSGRFKPGHSGNKGGRPRDIGNLRELAQAGAARAIEVMIEALEDDDPRIRLTAAGMLLDRGYGKPAAVDEEQIIRDELAKMTDEALEALHAAERRNAADADDGYPKHI